jgi:SAM-dependent methyltransferase
VFSADASQLDPAIRGYYDADKEDERLFARLGRLEFARTQELVQRHLPPGPLSILDVGGGTGVYADWLSGLGYRVQMIDPVPIHVERAQARAREHPGTSSEPSFTALVGDARRLTEPNASFDAVLLFGPLYHLTERADRQAALVEARRVLRPGGLLFAVAISRFAPLLDGLREGWLADPDFRQVVERDLAEGQHRNPRPEDRPGWFTTAYMHHPDELAREVSVAGFTVDALYGVEGPGWPLKADWDDPALREQILYAARAVEREPALVGMSPHVLAVARA